MDKARTSGAILSFWDLSGAGCRAAASTLEGKGAATGAGAAGADDVGDGQALIRTRPQVQEAAGGRKPAAVARGVVALTALALAPAPASPSTSTSRSSGAKGSRDRRGPASPRLLGARACTSTPPLAAPAAVVAAAAPIPDARTPLLLAAASICAPSTSASHRGRHRRRGRLIVVVAAAGPLSIIPGLDSIRFDRPTIDRFDAVGVQGGLSSSGSSYPSGVALDR